MVNSNLKVKTKKKTLWSVIKLGSKFWLTNHFSLSEHLFTGGKILNPFTFFWVPEASYLKDKSGIKFPWISAEITLLILLLLMLVSVYTHRVDGGTVCHFTQASPELPAVCSAGARGGCTLGCGSRVLLPEPLTARITSEKAGCKKSLPT